MSESKKSKPNGLAEKCKSIRRQYDETLKRRVVESVVVEGLTALESSRHYNIPPSSIRDWIKKFSSEIVGVKTLLPMTEEEEKELQSLKREKEQMAKALKEAQLKISGLETLITVAEKELKIDIRKKSGSKQCD